MSVGGPNQRDVVHDYKVLQQKQGKAARLGARGRMLLKVGGGGLVRSRGPRGNKLLRMG